MSTFFEAANAQNCFFLGFCQALMLEEFWKNNRASQLEKILQSSFFGQGKQLPFSIQMANGH